MSGVFFSTHFFGWLTDLRARRQDDGTVSPDQALASGGNGDLWRATWLQTGEQVVVKFLREHHLADVRRALPERCGFSSTATPASCL